MERIAAVERLVPHLRSLEAYVPGEQPQGSDWIKLNTNEFPYPIPGEVVQAIAAESRQLRLYPEPKSRNLREKLALREGLTPEKVIVGNGSDEILRLLAHAFGGMDKRVLETSPSYSLYPVVTAIAGGKLTSILFGNDFKLPVESLIRSDADLIFLTSPNAPTGVAFPLAEIERLVDGVKGLVVVDEAYVEFHGESAVALMAEYSNLVVTRTFSKAYGLAGLRVGYAFAAPEVIEVLDRVRDSYNVNRISQVGACAALSCESYYADCIKRICHSRDRLISFLEDSKWRVYPSRSNFVFAAPANKKGELLPERTQALFEFLREQKILVRYFPNHLLTASYLRITVGSEREMDLFMEALKKWKLHV